MNRRLLMNNLLSSLLYTEFISTGIVATVSNIKYNDKTVVDFELIDIPSEEEGLIFGTTNIVGIMDNRYLSLVGTSGKLLPYLNQYIYSHNSQLLNVGVLYNYIFNGEDGLLSINDTWIGDFNSDIREDSPVIRNNYLYIGSAVFSDRVKSNLINMKLYKLEMYSVDGELKALFIPVNKTLMLDTVTGITYTTK